jgi:1A family penicillin-binding protein
MHYLRDHLRQMRHDWGEARGRHPRVVAATVFAFSLAATLSIGGGIWFLNSLQRSLPNEAAISRIGEMDQATVVYDRDDTLAFTIFKEQRIEAGLAQMSPHLIDAIVATEDQRFRDHHGFDLVRIASAAMANQRSRRAAQGGSTITQQLARQSFLTPAKTVRRKIQELILASRIERMYPKDKILELYLNKVYFGDGLYGAEAASRGYFGKHASELTVAEAAMLAGLVKSPSSYAPTVGMDRAIARRNVVLDAMLETGAIDRPTFKIARAAKPVIHDDLREDEPYGQYFKEHLRRELVDRFGWQRVYQGGLRVFSTIDLGMQQAAEAAVAGGLKAVETRRRALAAARQKAGRTRPDDLDADPLQAALFAMDPHNGHVRAIVGGRDFKESPFNRAVQAERQPGSAFKPFVYAAALEAGFTPATLIDNLDTPIATVQGAWTPEDGHSSAQAMTLRTALRISSNRAAVRVLQEVGIGRTVQYARTMGVGDVPSVPSLALGSGEVTLQSLTAAYATFANHGRVPQPLVIRRVEDRDGVVLYTAKESSTYAISDITAYLMTSMMADVINAGTGADARRLGFTLPAAGKTGTTNDFHDAWFVGFTPKLATGVWVGFDRPRTILPNGFAATIAVPVWSAFMKAATRNDKPEWLKLPPSVTTARVCSLSGKLASDGCQDAEVVARDGSIERRSLVYTEYFASGTQPTEFCEMHPTRGFFGAMASVFHPGETPALPSVADAGLPPGSVRPATSVPPPPGSVAVSTPDVAAAVPPPAKARRGFWSRILGVGNNKDQK